MHWCQACRGHSQSLPGPVNEGLAERLVLWDGLENGAFLGHIANGPLTETRTAQTEDVTVQ